MRDLITDGWQPTEHPEDVKDPYLKRHPLLVPWEQLSEEEREKDRDSIMSLPTQLATAGYEIRLPERDDLVEASGRTVATDERRG